VTGVQCPGRGCLTTIPDDGRGLCQFCARRRSRPTEMTPVADVVATIKKEQPTCACGGLSDGEMHEESLLHRRMILITDGPKARAKARRDGFRV
jgi:hypothetical protein